MAMPPPMVPAPMTATRCSSRRETFLSRFGTLDALRSAKNTCCRALAWLFFMHCMNSSRSRAMPCSKGSDTAASSASTMRCGANRFFFSLARRWRAVSKKPAGNWDASIFRSRILRSGACRAGSASAYASAPPSKSASTILSMTPASRAAGAGTGSPETMMPNAASTQIRRGSRCVPPTPGRIPSFTSDRPTLAEATATR